MRFDQKGNNPARHTALALGDYHENHLCANCGAKRGAHAGPLNPHVAPGACPSGEFPAWPSTIRDEGRAGRVFDLRVRKFWKASKSTFEPKR